MEEILKQYEAREKQKINILGNTGEQNVGLQPGTNQSMYNVFQQKNQKTQDTQFGSSILGQKRNLAGNQVNSTKGKVTFEDFVTKSMNKCKTKSERQQMKKQLLQELQKMRDVNQVDLKTYDFQKIQVPILQRERQNLIQKVQKKGQTAQNTENASNGSIVSEQNELETDKVESLTQQISRVDAVKSALVYLKQSLFQSQNNDIKTLQIQKNGGVVNPFKKIQLESQNSNQLQQQQQKQQNKVIQIDNDDDDDEDELVLGDLVERVKKSKQKTKTTLQQKIEQRIEQKIGSTSMADRFKPIEIEQSLEEYTSQQLDQEFESAFKTTSFVPKKINVQNKMEYKPYQYTQHDDHQTQQNIIGVSKLLEKQYLRIQGEADPSEIRPLEFLKKSFVFVIQKYQQTQDYCYIQQQLRAIRQDMLVQRIRNNFTVRVFEENCRISLENQDKFEFIRCLHEIMTMYNEGLQGQYNEFTYYSLLLHIVQKDETHLQQLLSKLNNQQLCTKQIENALLYRQVIKLGNVYKFFKMYRKEKGYGKFILDFYIDRMRRWGVKMICKSYGPKEVPLNFFIEFLNFNGYDQCYKFFKDIQATIQRQNIQIKETLATLNAYKETQ